jgi:hypothetical protein
MFGHGLPGRGPDLETDSAVRGFDEEVAHEFLGRRRRHAAKTPSGEGSRQAWQAVGRREATPQTPVSRFRGGRLQGVER